MASNKLTGDAFLAALEEPAKPKKLGYVLREGIRSLSYSRLNTFHSCPRKFHIGEMRGARGFDPTIHTAFGHAYGAGVQTYMQYVESSGHEVAKMRAVVAAIAAYDYADIFEELPRVGKSFNHAIIAVENFCEMTAPLICAEYKLAIIDGKPAVELFFLLQIGEHTDYQGHIDLVLEHRESGELYVAEIKSKGGDTHPAEWQNSFQTLGYNTILHAFRPTGTNFNVLYLVFNTKDLITTPLSFSKSAAHRAEFLTSLLQEVAVMDMYEEQGYWPKRGNSCYAWNKPCYLFGLCDSPLAEVNQGDAYESLTMDDVDIYLHIDTLLSSETAELSDDINWELMQ